MHRASEVEPLYRRRAMSRDEESGTRTDHLWSNTDEHRNSTLRNSRLPQNPSREREGVAQNPARERKRSCSKSIKRGSAHEEGVRGDEEHTAQAMLIYIYIQRERERERERKEEISK